MNKIVTLSAGIALSLAFAGSAFAQYYPGNYSGSCVELTGTLSYNSRGAQVSELQNFLVSQNFPGGGSWMVTGYFGGATTQAVKDFQQEVGLPVTGVVDAQTASGIQQMTCGGSVNLAPPYTNYSNTTYPTTYPNTIPWNNYNPQYPYGYNGTSLNITTLSQNTGSTGQTVTIYGTGFDPSNNTVNFGSQSIPDISSNGTSLTFTIPSYYGLTSYSYSGTAINLSVSDSRGTSNTLTFTLYGGGNTCGSTGIYPYNQYPYGSTNCSCNYGYSYSLNNWYGSNNCGYNNNPGNTYAPTVSYLSPTAGAVGTTVAVFGSGFTSTGNSVHFGNGVIANLGSNNGTSLSFTVPSSLTGYGNQNVALGTYEVSVTNGNGYSTSQLPFTITALGNNGILSIQSISAPTTLSAGQSGTWTVVVNNPNGGSVTVMPTWGDTNVYPYNGTVIPQTTSAQSQTTLTFTHSYTQSGTYTITFTASANNSASVSTSATVTVSGASNSGTPSISYISPSSGYVGQQVTIYGSNFNNIDTIEFGSGAIQNVYGGTNSITFTIPSTVTPYCTPGLVCAQYVQQINPGTYNVAVMNQWGTSNEVPFTVQ